LNIGSLGHGRLDLKESAHLADDDFIKWTRRVAPRAGDVLFSYETRLGEAALMPPGIKACLGRRMALLRARVGHVDPVVLLHAYLDRRFQRTIEERKVHGATVDRIPLSELSSWPMVIPVGDMADRSESRLNALHGLINSNDRATEVLVQMRDALLPKLMSGEIRVRDAEKLVEDAT